MKSIRLRIGRTGLDFDRDYGTAHRTGWTAIHRESCLYPHLTKLPIALLVLTREVLRAARPLRSAP